MQLDNHFEMLDELKIIDTSETIPKILLHLLNGQVVHSASFYDMPDWFTNYLIKITRTVYPNI